MIPTFVLLAALSSGAYEPVPELHKVPGPAFLIPCKVEAAEVVAVVQLWVSADRGKTWQMHEEITPAKTGFTFVAKRAGEYWFAPRIKKKDGTHVPAELSNLVATQRVAVEAGSETVNDGPPLVSPRPLPRSTARDTVDELDGELTRVELEMIRKEIKRVSELNALSPEAEEKIDRLRGRLREVRDRLHRDRDPLVSDPTRGPTFEWTPSASPPLPPPSIVPTFPAPDDDRIPPGSVPMVRPTVTPVPARPVAPPPRIPVPR